MKIERILCPTNLSPESDEALRYAIALSRAYAAELVLLHCEAMGEGVVRFQDYESANKSIEAALKKHAGLSGIRGCVGEVWLLTATMSEKPSRTKLRPMELI
jgi:nucleotide-binding universal stress UspA family protein